MTCQHCETWVLDDDHRCRRCGRRLRSTPFQGSPAIYPVATTATAPAYDFYLRDEADPAFAPRLAEPIATPAQQQALPFSAPQSDSRVIPFDSSAADAARRSIQARAESARTSPSTFSRDYPGPEISRPAPLTAEKVQVRRAHGRKSQSSQRHLELFGNEEVLSQPESTIICDAPVAPVSLRVRAGLIDVSLMAAGCAVAAAVVRLCSGSAFMLDKHAMPFLALALITIPLFYRLLWAYAGLDSMGMQMAGLRLVDFDGNPPSHERRYHRIFGSILSVLAAGMGLIWSFVDQDRLSWHDHISSTFPTVVSEG